MLASYLTKANTALEKMEQKTAQETKQQEIAQQTQQTEVSLTPEIPQLPEQHTKQPASDLSTEQKLNPERPQISLEPATPQRTVPQISLNETKISAQQQKSKEQTGEPQEEKSVKILPKLIKTQIEAIDQCNKKPLLDEDKSDLSDCAVTIMNSIIVLAENIQDADASDLEKIKKLPENTLLLELSNKLNTYPAEHKERMLKTQLLNEEIKQVNQESTLGNVFTKSLSVIDYFAPGFYSKIMLPTSNASAVSTKQTQTIIQPTSEITTPGTGTPPATPASNVAPTANQPQQPTPSTSPMPQVLSTPPTVVPQTTTFTAQSEQTPPSEQRSTDLLSTFTSYVSNFVSSTWTGFKNILTGFTNILSAMFFGSRGGG